MYPVIYTPTYHFVKEIPQVVARGELPLVRVTSEHLASDFFDTAKYFLDGTVRFVVKNCLGSLILIDKTRKDLNKLHIGNLLIRHPHIEFYDSSGQEGPRVDLHEVDIDYAKRRLEELTLLRSPEQRRATLSRYSEPPICNWYSTPHRLKQLGISSQGLEAKIEEIQETIEHLQAQAQNTFVSDTAKKLEEMGYALIGTIAEKVKSLPKPLINRSQKIISDPNVVSNVDEMYRLLNKIFDFVIPRVNLEEARNYWARVDAWEKL